MQLLNMLQISANYNTKSGLELLIMTGYMIYEKNDAQKNKMYVEMHKEAFADFGVDIKLVLTDKIYK